jgi:hypothetical protein
LLFIAGFLAIAGINYYLVSASRKAETIPQITSDNPVVEALFITLKDCPQAKLLGPYQGFQIQCLMAQSFVMLGYFLKVRPFESPTMNFLQVFNELVVIAAIMHMFIFSDGISTTTPMRINAGWTFVMIICLQIVVNLTCFTGMTSYQAFRVIRQKIRVFQHKRKLA